MRYSALVLPLLVLWISACAPALAQDGLRSVEPATEAATAPPGSAAEAVAFYVLAAVAAGSALGCVVAANIVRMAMCLLGTLGAVALLYFQMSANFLGVIQLIVYVGGTLVVIIFGVMLTSRTFGTRLAPRPGEVLAGVLVCAALLVGLVTILIRTGWAPAAPQPQEFPVARIGQELLSTYLVPFEAVSVLLLAAMIGASYLAQPEAARRSGRARPGGRRPAAGAAPGRTPPAGPAGSEG